MSKAVGVIVGVGEGNGAAWARAFAKAGLTVAVLARQTGFIEGLAASLPGARAYACDVADQASVAQTFARIRSELGDPTTWPRARYGWRSNRAPPGRSRSTCDRSARSGDEVQAA
jgi:NAD(P)-dependent dehydrogenase (short-subunit alcohol dehydrogenase family)